MLEQALGQMGKELPEELTKRMSLNRFFAIQRDIVNDELEALVPDLIEDALENPTGSYQIVSKYQNLKLDQIDKNNSEILIELAEIKKLLGKVSAGGGAGGADGGLLGNLLDMLGVGGAVGLGAKAAFGGKKSKKSKKQTKFQRGLRLAKTGGKIGVGLALASYLFGDKLTDIDPGQIARDLGYEGLGDTLDTVGGVAETALLSGASAAGMVKAKEFAGKPATPTATQTSSNYSNVVKDERLKGTKYYTQDPTTGKTKFISMAEGAAAEKAGSVTYKGNATPTATPTRPTTSMSSSISSAVRGGANKVWASVKWVAGKAATPLMLATAVWDAWSQISALDKSLPRNEYASEVTKILADVVKTYGIIWVSSMLGSLIAGGAGAVAGGIGAIPGALIGFASGLILGGAIEYTIGDDISSVVNRVVDYVYGTGEYKQANQPPAPTVNSFATMGAEGTVEKGSTSFALGGAKIPDQKTNQADLPASGASPSSGQVTTPLTAAMSSLASLGGGEMAAGGIATSGLVGGLMSNQSKLSNFAQLGMDKATGLGGNLAALALGTGAVTGDKLKQLGIISPDASPEEVNAAVKQYSDMTKNAGPTLTPEQIANETGTSQTAIQNMFAQNGKTVSENTIDNNPNAEFQKMIDQMMTNFQAQNTGVVNNINAPAMSTSAMPKFTDLQTPASMAITALRAQGLADVYSHPQAGSTIERSNRGGETTFI